MTEMIERVAMAISDKYWGFATDFGKEEFRNEARAAIEAMRKPTEEIVFAGQEICDHTNVHIQNDEYVSALDVWNAMIEAALAPVKASE